MATSSNGKPRFKRFGTLRKFGRAVTKFKRQDREKTKSDDDIASDKRERTEVETDVLRKELETCGITEFLCEIRLRREIDSLQTKSKEKQMYVNRLESEVDSLQKAALENIKLKSKLESIEDARKELENENKSLKEAKQKNVSEIHLLQSELKKVENARKDMDNEEKRCRNQNPKITDISDPIRPIKLAEKASGLYDDEWMDALEKLDSLGIQEERGIKILLNIIRNIYDTCVEFADLHLEAFPDLLVLPPAVYQLQKDRVLKVEEISSEMLQLVKDFRKYKSCCVITQLQKYFSDERKSKLRIKHNIFESCKGYINKCVELCWMMRIQDPPLYMETRLDTNSPFDSNKMRSFTKSGKFVCYGVWPAIFLYKDGPLLTKGIAQGCNSKITNENEDWDMTDYDDTDDEFVYARLSKTDADRFVKNLKKKAKEPAGLS